MYKKIASYLIYLFFIGSLIACGSLALNKDEKPSTDSRSIIFIDPSIARFMGDDDRNRLQVLVATASAEQSVHWYSARTGARFNFISHRIFVNARGEGCRAYQIRMDRGFLNKPLPLDYIACRNSQGIWQLADKSVKKGEAV